MMTEIYASKLQLNNVKVVSNSQEQRNVQLKGKYTICPLISRHIAVHEGSHKRDTLLWLCVLRHVAHFHCSFLFPCSYASVPLFKCLF